MNYIEFDKEKLVNISYSKKRELLRCSRTGAFATTTLLRLNTRKYHGLFIVPQDKIDQERHVLVSNLNESVVMNDMEFRLGIHQYKGGVIDPKGNKYMQRFVAEPLPTYYYRVGKFNFKSEILFLNNADRLIIKYTILDDVESVSFQFQPLLAFRQIHQLTHKNDVANTGYDWCKNGVKYCLYDNYTPVYIQCSEEIYYEHHPVWYENFEYEEEIERGYEGIEDLLNPGKINVKLKNQALYITLGTEEIDPSTLEMLYEEEIKRHTNRSTYFNCLKNAAEQFIVKRNGKTEVIAGYPWFGRWGRDTFIALPGLTLALGQVELCKEIMDTMLTELQDGLFPNIGASGHSAYNSVDAPLWFFHTLQQYTHFIKKPATIWQEYGTAMKSILNAYKNGALYNIRMTERGLIHAGCEGKALTWMDAIVNGKPVTPRTGFQVEINALWYNALCFASEMAKIAKDTDFVDEWKEIIKTFPDVFKETFWSKEHGWLADYVDGNYKNFQVRPNMLIATALPYCPISEKIRQLILKKCTEELLTNKGLRTLSPNDPDYKGYYAGDQATRDAAYHQGTCWPWLLIPFTNGMVAVHQKKAFPVLEKLYYDFEHDIKDYGISTIGEIFDGAPPHRPNGCISQAWSVAALLYMKWVIDNGKTM
ncbi:MAG: glycogen debranching enzyme family protein [Bacteroidales bacterium]|nr:glycogen debranching enzyme family protein [Bacteroidales bacterium]